MSSTPIGFTASPADELNEEVCLLNWDNFFAAEPWIFQGMQLEPGFTLDAITTKARDTIHALVSENMLAGIVRTMMRLLLNEPTLNDEQADREAKRMVAIRQNIPLREALLASLSGVGFDWSTPTTPCGELVCFFCDEKLVPVGTAGKGCKYAAVLYPCKHAFGHECVEKWIRSQYLLWHAGDANIDEGKKWAGTCPYCRAELSPWSME